MIKTSLEHRVRLTMDIAKNLLLKDGSLVAAAIFTKEGLPDYPMVLDFSDEKKKLIAHQQVQEFIREFRPDFCIMIAEAWMKKVERKDIESYRRGDVAKSHDKVEIISVVGGSVGGTFGILQPFHREGKQIVFEEAIENKLGFESAFFGNAWEEIACEEIKNWN